MKAYDDEIFGPVLGVSRVASYAEAVAMVNANQYGNGVAIFPPTTANTARLFSREVSADDRRPTSDSGAIAAYSFGGWKNSLFRAHSHI